jgi:hypothetical protein
MESKNGKNNEPECTRTHYWVKAKCTPQTDGKLSNIITTVRNGFPDIAFKNKFHCLLLHTTAYRRPPNVIGQYCPHQQFGVARVAIRDGTHVSLMMGMAHFLAKRHSQLVSESESDPSDVFPFVCCVDIGTFVRDVPSFQHSRIEGKLNALFQGSRLDFGGETGKTTDAK